MKERLKKELKMALVIFLFLTIVYGVFYFLSIFKEPSVTGLVVYEITEHTKQWDFTNPNEYTYDTSLINITGVNLIGNVEIIKVEDYSYENYYVTEAIYNGNDKTSQISSIDNNHITADKDKILNVIFDNELNNNDIISLYIKESDISDIYLCDYNTSCDSPGYGLINYDGGSGWYNITISELNTPVDRFNIDPIHVKIDYIYVTRFINNSYDLLNITYPDSAVIDTQDLIVSNFDRWGVLTVNGNNIDYYYSTDGNSWNLIEDFNLIYVNSNTIRLRVNLTQDSILNSLSLKYFTSVACNEDWECTNWPTSCYENETQIRSCVDNNACGSEDNKPNLTRTCEYVCVEDWQCDAWTTCYNNGTQTRLCTDNNACMGENNKPNETKSCEYVSNESDVDLILANFTSSLIVDDQTLTYSFSYGTNKTFSLNKSDIFLDIETSLNITNGSISITNYENNIKDIQPSFKELGKYVEIIADDSIKDNLVSNIIKIYYTDEEINNANLDEDTLKIYYFNETSNEWQELDSVVNKTGNYVSTNIDHLSFYGVFGQQKQSVVEPSTEVSSSSGGGGSTSSSGRFITKKVEKVEEIVEVEETIEVEVVECNYEISSSIEDKISFVEEHEYPLNIENKGCKLDEVSLSVDMNLVTFSNSTFWNIEEGSNIELLLQTKQIIETKQDLIIQGFAAKTIEKKIKEYTIDINIKGIVDNEIVISKDIPVVVTLIIFDNVSKRVLPYSFIIIGLLVCLIIAVFFFFYNEGKKKVKKIKKSKLKKKKKKVIN